MSAAKTCVEFYQSNTIIASGYFIIWLFCLHFSTTQHFYLWKKCCFPFLVSETFTRHLNHEYFGWFKCSWERTDLWLFSFIRWRETLKQLTAVELQSIVIKLQSFSLQIRLEVVRYYSVIVPWCYFKDSLGFLSLYSYVTWDLIEIIMDNWHVNRQLLLCNQLIFFFFFSNRFTPSKAASH